MPLAISSLTLWIRASCFFFAFVHSLAYDFCSFTRFLDGSFVLCAAFNIEIGDSTMSQCVCATTATTTTTKSQCNKCQRFEMVVIAKINNICILYLVACQLKHFRLNFNPLNGVFFLPFSHMNAKNWKYRNSFMGFILWIQHFKAGMNNNSNTITTTAAATAIACAAGLEQENASSMAKI